MYIQGPKSGYFNEPSKSWKFLKFWILEVLGSELKYDKRKKILKIYEDFAQALYGP
jgi:hypothetical protein